MRNNDNDMQKAEAIWASLNEVTGTDQPFPAEEIAGAMALLHDQMEQEDPDHLIPCSCHGDMWHARDVDFWGFCPYGRGEDSSQQP